MPLQATSGAASYDAFGGGVPVVPAYIEEVFSTYLYTGNETSQTINNGIDLAGKGGLVWIKKRNASAFHILSDTARGIYNYLQSDSTDAQISNTGYVTAFNSDGFSIGGGGNINYDNLVSWTFRKQPKFFDVVTYTGNGSTQTINHNLGSAPGCIIVKSTSASGSNWFVYHRSLGVDDFLILNLTNAALGYNGGFSNITSTSFGVADSNNGNGATFVAYLFAHDAGGFGLTGTDSVISCGGFTTDGGGLATVSLGYEPQWLMIKRTGTTGDWQIMDTMRGFVNNSSGGDAVLKANSSDAESTFTLATPTSTGFLIDGNAANAPIIYIAIRRGPMKVPTSGTSVYNAISRTGTGAAANITGVGFPPDFIMARRPSTAGDDNNIWDRLRGATKSMYTQGTAGESTNANTVTAFGMDGVSVGTSQPNAASDNYINWFFKRAPSVFDIVCYTGTLATLNVSHNLGAVPQLIITKSRSATGNWTVQPLSDGTKRLRLQTTAAEASDAGPWDNTNPTSSIFTLGGDTGTNASGVTYVAYLFATCAGVSKVFSFTGNGSSQTINCGFTGGARWVMIKRTDSTGDWYVWDSTRGIVAGNDPHLSLNTTDAEVTTDDSVDTDNTGFIVNQLSATDVNVTSATYIGIAIA